MFMCGIAGYVGVQPAAPLLTKALERLVYRGYDSAGVATLNGVLTVKKGAGALEELEASLGFSKLPGTSGVAHTRWATHGGVTDANAHPHLDCTGTVAVVHNGVVDNYEELKGALEAQGHKFSSQTDTEVIPHLIEQEQKQSLPFLDTVKAALAQLKGTYAVLVLSSKHPKELIAGRCGSPLVLAQTTHGTLAASDTLALLDHTSEVYYLEDYEMVRLLPEELSFYDRTGQRIARTRTHVPWKAEQAAREGYPHFMLKEIYEQPKVLAAALHQDPVALEAFMRALSSAQRIVLLGCGTSLHACLLGKLRLAPRVSAPIDVCVASEAASLVVPGEGTVVLAVSQSGETMDVLTAVRALKAKGVRVLSLVNVPGSSLARESEACLFLNCGPEIGVAATKSYLAQLALFYLLEAHLAGRGTGELVALPALVGHALKLAEMVVPKIAQKLSSHDHAFYLGRGANASLAMEAALKLKEIAYIHAEGFAGGELKHGPLALIRKGTPIVTLIAADAQHESILTNTQETRARGGYVIGVSDQMASVFDEWIAVPTLSGRDAKYYPFAAAPALQLLAYHCALLRGANPDRPVNLAKSCTVL